MFAFKIIIIVFSLFTLFELFSKIKSFYCIKPIVIVFDFTMVVPIILELFLGKPHVYYRSFALAMADYKTELIYLCFVFMAQIVFFLEIIRVYKKGKKEFKKIDLKETLPLIKNVKYANKIPFLCGLVFILVIIGILLSPNPNYYFSINSVHTTKSVELITYNKQVMSPLIMLLGISTIVLKLIDVRDSYLSFFIRVFFTIVVVFVNQKRTLLLLIVGACLTIDLVNEKPRKKIIVKYGLLFFMVALYFYLYSYITDKISYNSDWYYVMNEYFFRSMHMKFAIYSALNPDKIHILDYPGQSILFSLLFFIPRAIWPNKPYAYIDYYISAVCGYNTRTEIGYTMPVSYYPEFVSNFGIIGLPLSLMFTVWLARFFDNRKKLCKFLGVALISVLGIYYYDDAMKILAFVTIVLWLKEYIVFRDNSIIIQKQKNLDLYKL